MGHGSVSDEIKGRRNIETKGQARSLLKINEEGAKFRSYVDGSLHFLTPEASLEIQRKLGADLIVVLDECTPFNVDKEYVPFSTSFLFSFFIIFLIHGTLYLYSCSTLFGCRVILLGDPI